MPQREEILMKVAAFAADAHAGQIRKYVDEPYVEHPVRVMYTCMSYDLPVPVLAAALLHDVIEDTKVTPDELLKFLRTVFSNDNTANQVLAYVLELTDVYIKADYPHWNRRIRKAAELERLKLTAPDVQTIKYADILDNSTAIAKQDPGFAAVLLKEYQQQLEALTKGNLGLKELATNQVSEALASVSKREDSASAH